MERSAALEVGWAAAATTTKPSRASNPCAIARARNIAPACLRGSCNSCNESVAIMVFPPGASRVLLRLKQARCQESKRHGGKKRKLGSLDRSSGCRDPSDTGSQPGHSTLGGRIGEKSQNSHCAMQRTAFYRKFPQLVNNFTSLTQTLVAHRKNPCQSGLDFLC